MLDERSKRWLGQPSCSVMQAAAMLGLSRNAAYEAIARQEIKSVRIGRRIVVPTAPLRELLMVEAGGAGVRRQRS